MVHEVGEEHALHGSESADPNVSEAKADKTEVGDWFSFSDTDELGDGDLSSWLEAPVTSRTLTGLRG